MELLCREGILSPYWEYFLRERPVIDRSRRRNIRPESLRQKDRRTYTNSGERPQQRPTDGAAINADEALAPSE